MLLGFLLEILINFESKKLGAIFSKLVGWEVKKFVVGYGHGDLHKLPRSKDSFLLFKALPLLYELCAETVEMAQADGIGNG